MKVYAKLIKARNMLRKLELKKSGHNKFAGYQYFELGDFLPYVEAIFEEVGLCDVIYFDKDMAYMNLYDVDDGSFTVFTSPMGSASLKGCHEVQNIGAVETYQRRYLYTTALAIVEHDALDAKTGEVEAPVKTTPKVEVKVEPKIEPKKLEGKSGDWQLKVSTEGDWDQAVKQATNILLSIAKTVDDVNNIYKVNRVIYDELKEKHKIVFDEIMNVFKITKEELK
jgi:hypothetical protein